MSWIRRSGLLGVIRFRLVLIGDSFPTENRLGSLSTRLEGNGDRMAAVILHPALTQKQAIERGALPFELGNLIEVVLFEFCNGALM